MKEPVRVYIETFKSLGRYRGVARKYSRHECALILRDYLSIASKREHMKRIIHRRDMRLMF